MFNGWIHWLLSLDAEQLAWLLAPILLFDITRYSLGAVGLWFVDFTALLLRRSGCFAADPYETQYAHCPSICVVIAGLNEADRVAQTLASVHGTYPRMEIIVVDDGSQDGMADVARQFADQHRGVLVLRKPHRGGKSSALNFAIPFTQAEILVCVDADSHLAENALWEIVQPFRDARVGAVAGTVVAREPFAGFVNWLQALEYLRCIFIGRQVSARLGLLGIVSGAFGAYRRDAIGRLKGWDVGPGEDGDVTLRLRKSGYRIAFAPYAQCLTALPASWWRLVKQRRRWEWAVVTHECRKHIDLANWLDQHFQWPNLLLMLERWAYNVAFTYVLWGYAAWTMCHWHEHTWKQILLYYLAYVVLELLNVVVILYYSISPGRDLLVGLAAPCMPLYNVLMRAVTLWSITEEILTRRSYRDDFVPEHVRAVTWHW
ncbi:MAG: glycosyltransferase [Pirellulaceae bacterium]